MKYEILDDITMADIAFCVYGDSPEELFFSAARVLAMQMVENIDSISFKESRTFNLKEPSLEMLYLNFLDEFLFLKDSESLLLLPVEINIHTHEEFQLTCTARGEEIDNNKHNMITDVKAITMHHFSLT